MGLRDPSLTLISTLVGSGGLVIFMITSIYSNLNQPNIDLGMFPHLRSEDKYMNLSRISYYEIIAKNIGLAQAKNLTLSMFTRAIIKQFTPVVYDQDIPYIKYGNVSNHKTSFGSAYLPKLSPNAQIIDVLTNGRYEDSYYVSATYDQGSNTLWFINGSDIGTGNFPNVSKSNTQPPVDSNILLIAAVVSAISFTLAFGHMFGKQMDITKRGNFLRNIFVILPASVAGSAFILIVFEDLFRGSVMRSMFIPPLDITTTIHYLK